MNKFLLIYPLFLFFGVAAWAQSGATELDRNINYASHNVVYPAVSGDGRVMVFMTDYSDDGNFAMMMTKYRAGKWEDPVDANVIGSSKVNNWGGYSLNYDGTVVYFSSRRSNGLGKYDLWYSEYANGEWSRPANVGKPVNSEGNEGNPSISADGQRLYFMQCESMSNDDVSGCQIYYSDRGPRGWEAPVKLPDHLNVGNTTSPRILPDNKTLAFASDRPGGKGGVDLWLSKRTGEHWSEPLNISAVNTKDNDLFLSVTIRSIAYFTTINSKGNKVISEMRLPEDFRLADVIIQQGTIRDELGNNLSAEVRAYNLNTNQYEARLRVSPTDDDFIMILPEGARYDIAISEIRQNKMYHSEIIDAMDLVAPRREYPNIILYDLKEGLEFDLTGVKFQSYAAEIESAATLELGRLERILTQHPELRVEVGVYQKAYYEDDSRSDQDLTEIRTDTVYVKKPALRIDTLTNEQKDSLITDINSLLASTIADTTLANTYMAQMAASDSILVEEPKTIYHNDRTTQQAESVRSVLVSSGIEASRIEIVGYREKQPPFEFASENDRMVVIRFLNGKNDD